MSVQAAPAAQNGETRSEGCQQGTPVPKMFPKTVSGTPYMLSDERKFTRMIILS